MSRRSAAGKQLAGSRDHILGGRRILVPRRIVDGFGICLRRHLVLRDRAPGSRPDVVGGSGLVVSQWNTTLGWPYRAMQFRATIRDTTADRGRDPADPVNL